MACSFGYLLAFSLFFEYHEEGNDCDERGINVGEFGNCPSGQNLLIPLIQMVYIPLSNPLSQNLGSMS